MIPRQVHVGCLKTELGQPQYTSTDSMVMSMSAHTRTGGWCQIHGDVNECTQEGGARSMVMSAHTRTGGWCQIHGDVNECTQEGGARSMVMSAHTRTGGWCQIHGDVNECTQEGGARSMAMSMSAHRRVVPDPWGCQ